MSHVLFFGFLILFSFLWAKLEINIEGPNGWAEKLPTWRIENKWTKWFYSDRPMTGFHFYGLLCEIMIVHLAFVVGIHWTVEKEALVLSFLLLFWVVEDFLWFVFNPAYGLKKFKPENIWWHKTWFLKVPYDYWLGVVIGTFLYLVGTGTIL